MLSAGGHAQVFVDPLNLSPRGLTDVPPARPPVPAQVPAAKASDPQPRETNPLPPDPFTSTQPVVFGSQIFTGRFGSEAFSGFNPDYQIAVGDRIHIRIWGAFNFDETQPVDAQGNVFIPNVGPVSVLGVRNADLTRQVEAQAKRTFRANTGVYATLEAAQPVKIYVTGFVRAPGLYGGLSSDSVLAYLDRAGGIDPDRGSYLEVDVLRAGKLRAKFNLYRFLLDGQIAPLQLQDGDTVVAYPRKHTVLVRGDVLNPYLFEFSKPVISAADLVAVARPRPSATHLSIVRKVGVDTRSEYHPLGAVANVTIQDGDEVLFTSDKYPGTILVRVEGAHLGERTLILPYGAKLQDALALLKPAPQANVDALQLYRISVAERQKEMLEASLRSLQTYALTSRSATSEEAALRTREADLIMQFIERARQTEPRGQVLLADREQAVNTLLEDGDVLRVPERSNLVLVSGEVLLPNALVWDPNARVSDYIQRAGGYNQDEDDARVVVLRQDGSVSDPGRGPLMPGDEVMVLPKIEAKSVEITRGITQIIYQLAVAAKVILDF
ncbi:MAG: polysaccharide biosynthesis/export family protein [Methylibium sp.]|nr:polysaccharide biosynthesis/export family protein [Methylibium sp.]